MEQTSRTLTLRLGKQSNILRFWKKFTITFFLQKVVEDVIAANAEKFEALQEILNFSSHHLSVNPVIIITHSAQRNGIYGLLPYMTHVFFSAVKSSVSSLQAVLRSYQFEKQERDSTVRKLLSFDEQFCHLKLDVEARETSFVKVERSKGHSRLVEVQPDQQKPNSEYPTLRQLEEQEGNETAKEAVAATIQDPSIKAKAKRFLKVLPEQKRALAIFDLLYEKLPIKKIDPADLTIKLKDANNSDTSTSIIDYISALTTPSLRPDKGLLQFHRYVKKRGIKLPKSYVLNKKFWRA